MATVWVPALMRELTGGRATVEAPGATLRQVIDNLDASYPGFRARVCDGDEVAHHIAVIVDGQVSRLRMQQPLAADSEVHFVPAVHGGA